jgi:hypothetical protein
MKCFLNFLKSNARALTLYAFIIAGIAQVYAFNTYPFNLGLQVSGIIITMMVVASIANSDPKDVALREQVEEHEKFRHDKESKQIRLEADIRLARELLESNGYEVQGVLYKATTFDEELKDREDRKGDSVRIIP